MQTATDTPFTAEDLKGGFKASANKARFDLIPRDTLADILPYKQDFTFEIFDSLEFGFWSTELWERLDSLNKALAKTFEFHSTVEGISKVEVVFKLGELYAIGAKKYSARNWELGMDWGDVYSAAIRHLMKFDAGETYDPVDGQHHLTSVAWNIVALIHYARFERYEKFDTRFVQTRAEEGSQK